MGLILTKSSFNKGDYHYCPAKGVFFVNLLTPEMTHNHNSLENHWLLPNEATLHCSKSYTLANATLDTAIHEEGAICMM